MSEPRATDLLTPTAAARLIRVGDGRIRAWIKDGRLPATKVKGRWLFEREALLTAARAEGVLDAATAAAAGLGELGAEEEVLNVAKTAKRLKVRTQRIHNWLADGTLTGTKVNGYWRLDGGPVAALEARFSQASWWRQEKQRHPQSGTQAAGAGRAVIEAAAAWRRDPQDPQLIANLIAAVDLREQILTPPPKKS